MTHANTIILPLHHDNRFVTLSAPENKHHPKQSNDQIQISAQNQDVAESIPEECLFTTLLCSDILLELLLHCSPQIAAYQLNKEITGLLTRIGDKFAEKACKRTWINVRRDQYAARSWKECFWIVDKANNPEKYIHRSMPYLSKNTKAGYLIHKVTPVKAKRTAHKQWMILKGSLLLQCRSAMELRPHALKVLTHECHAYLSQHREHRAVGQFHVHFPDDKTLTFVAGTLADGEEWVNALLATIAQLSAAQRISSANNSLANSLS